MKFIYIKIYVIYDCCHINNVAINEESFILIHPYIPQHIKNLDETTSGYLMHKDV